MRLAKYLAHAGVASRRAAETLVRGGHVAVGGTVILDPALDVDAGDEVTLDGAPVTLEARRVVYAVNKPPGVVSTAQDTHGRPTVVSLVPTELRLYPVGRLDIDTTGLLLLTNDGALAHRLTHPRFEVSKTYRVTVGGPPLSQRAIAALREGVELDDGRTAPARVRRLGPATIEITIHEGRNRQIKRMCEAVDRRVQRLERVAFGSLTLGGLAPGQYRRLGEPEIRALTSAGAAPSRRGASSS